MIEIRPARLPEDLPRVGALFREYQRSLGIDLCFQDFEVELATLPGRYAPPRGRLLLAWDGAAAVGCAALRPLDDGSCEMKRLYVQPGVRGQHLGRRLAERICDEAREAGYARICLDTLPGMSAAIALYMALGFTATAPYAHNPIDGALFLAREL
jgi:ribosomal protein S18 acetylase RimI-like enzyme